MVKLKNAAALVLAALILASCACAEVYTRRPPESWEGKPLLEWTIFDTDEGDAMLLRCEGEAMLVDGGPKRYRDLLRDALTARGLSHMKYMLATHYHDDHIDGIYYMLDFGFTADEYLHPYSDWETRNNKLQGRTYAEALKHGVTPRRLFGGDALKLGGADISVYRCTEFRNGNGKSLVLKVTYGESAALLCADIIGDAQHYFVETLPGEALKAQLIKMPHHALTPAVGEFLDAVAPDAAIVTNTLKGISNSARNQLEDMQLTTFFSGEGTVYAVTDGTDWYIYQSEGEF